MTLQLAVRGGTVVTAEGRFSADIGADGGQVVQLGGEVPAGETEIDANRLGGLAMKRLAELDQVAYVRFASVYRDFTGVRDFERFIARMADESEADDAASHDAAE